MVNNIQPKVRTFLSLESPNSSLPGKLSVVGRLPSNNSFQRLAAANAADGRRRLTHLDLDIGFNSEDNYLVDYFKHSGWGLQEKSDVTLTSSCIMSLSNRKTNNPYG